MAQKLLNSLYNLIKPKLPTMEQAKLQELSYAAEALHKLELHHLRTLNELEHYGAAKAELTSRIERLSCAP